MPPFDPAQGDSPPANQRDPTSRIGGRQADGDSARGKSMEDVLSFCVCRKKATKERHTAQNKAYEKSRKILKRHNSFSALRSRQTDAFSTDFPVVRSALKSADETHKTKPPKKKI
jgi:hypothetical protein